ncbi:MAG: GH92 family glycosyl hydrolase [Crocinitomicaceae bacterium]|nr:GH92 family glycosyl hydrolase [Crocinitomicaceae bacterium]
MFRILSILTLSIVANSMTFGQIEELKKNADKAEEVFNGVFIPSEAFSKTLFVNPFIGTGGHGHTYPGASSPFGMMQLSPDTRYDGWDGCGGYHYSDSIIYGFSHTHLSGTGVSDYADLLITPQVGKPKTEGKFIDPNGYGHRFSHDREQAVPGFYSVDLIDAKIRAEFTVDVHSGLHKYTFHGQNQKKYILLDLDYRDELLSADFETIAKNKIKGHRISKAWAEEQHFYFYLESNIDWKKAKQITKNGRHKLLLEFPKDTKELMLRVGISAVDTEGAEKNLKAEIVGFDFVAQRVKANHAWENELSKIHFDADKNTKTIFYTALYHSFLAPNTFSDVDGRYRGMDKQFHQLEDKNDKQFTVFSLWDTFRATHPLFTLTQEEKTNQFIRTFLRMDDQQKDLPVWELAGNETECMIGYHSVSVMADAYLKDYSDFSSGEMYSASLRTAKRFDFAKEFSYYEGYISLDKEPESVSKLLEYAYDEFCIDQMTKKMYSSAYVAMVDKQLAPSTRPYNFINHFDPKTKFFRARRGAMWMNDFKPDEVNFNYTEANAWQYSLFAPHAIGVLAKLHGGKSALETHLDNMFNAPSETSGHNQADITGLIGQYAHGNEPSHHMAYLYNHVNRPDKTQLYIDSILHNLYSNEPNGLSGNEDCGQMSSWYVLSALGIYQIAPGSPYYDIGRPLMQSAILDLPNRKKFVINVSNQSKSNKYIKGIYLNGKKLFRTYLSHDEIVNGGLLVFTMTDKPSEELKEFNSSPTLSEIPKNFTPIPFLIPENRVFSEKQIINFSLPYQNSDLSIQYKINDSEWMEFTSPFQIDESTLVSARTINKYKSENSNPPPKYVGRSERISATVSTSFVKKNEELQLKLITPYTLPYASSGENALIDGIQGNQEFRTGDWQGFYGFDVMAEIQFKEPKAMLTVDLGLLEDLKSWIFYPTEWTIEVSTDGVNFTKYRTDKINSSTNEYRPANIQKVSMNVAEYETVKAIRISVKNAGNCPDWHLGRGNPTWIFLDEISIH